MESRIEDYYETGDEKDFLEVGRQKAMIKKLTDFLVDADMEFEITYDDNTYIEIDKKVICTFFRAGAVTFDAAEKS